MKRSKSEKLWMTSAVFILVVYFITVITVITCLVQYKMGYLTREPERNWTHIVQFQGKEVHNKVAWCTQTQKASLYFTIYNVPCRKEIQNESDR